MTPAFWVASGFFMFAGFSLGCAFRFPRSWPSYVMYAALAFTAGFNFAKPNRGYEWKHVPLQAQVRSTE